MDRDVADHNIACIERSYSSDWQDIPHVGICEYDSRFLLRDLEHERESRLDIRRNIAWLDSIAASVLCESPMTQAVDNPVPATETAFAELHALLAAMQAGKPIDRSDEHLRQCEVIVERLEVERTTVTAADVQAWAEGLAEDMSKFVD